jgi:hypothetical protein
MISGENFKDGMVEYGAPVLKKQLQHLSLFTGVVAIFVRNRRNRFFVPSTENYFGKFQVRTAMHVTGCNSHLLAPSSTSELLEVVKYYSPESCRLYRYTFREIKGASSNYIVMLIESLSVNFAVFLCNDILGSELANIKVLRYYLCTEDVEALLNSGLLAQKEATILRNLQTTTPTTKRRSHALIGQDIFK